uniref:AAA+ ATPase domain-containing protein n=1 Tax=Rhodosorus marinus TaxID=101924 RepID=A0A7S2ZIQ1_9RHOD|mmetsp:Transcript_209/g.505  ORF Transcript_209/g.505 Transcript_209/m.505 type:complete len:337 (+) Transcript_209:186-1196(+)
MKPNNRGLLWVDKYRPATLEEMDFHLELKERLEGMAQRADIPHLLFHGPPGSGKRTRVSCLLRLIYGPAAEKLKVEHRSFKVGDPPKEIEMTILSSVHHIEANPSDAGFSDRLIVQELIKEIASNAPLDVTAVKVPFKVIVLHEVDSLSRTGQQALRRTMEKYSRTCRLILMADSLTKIIEPLRSRCNLVRVPSPSEKEICAVLQKVSKKEGFELPDQFAVKVTRACSKNLRRGLLQLQSSKMDNYPFAEDQVGATPPNIPSCTSFLSSSVGFFNPTQPVSRADWELVCIDIASLLMREQSNKRLLLVRTRFYELLTHAIPADAIFEVRSVSYAAQ